MGFLMLGLQSFFGVLNVRFGLYDNGDFQSFSPFAEISRHKIKTSD